MKLQEKIISEFPKNDVPSMLINNEGHWVIKAKTWLEVKDEGISACQQSLIFLEWDECLASLGFCASLCSLSPSVSAGLA